MIPMSSDDDFERNLREVFSFWQTHREDVSEENYQEAISLMDYYRHFSSRNQDIEDKVLDLARWMVQSLHFDPRDVFIESMPHQENILLVYDALGQNPMLPLWIETDDKKDIIDPLHRGVADRFLDTWYHFFEKHGKADQAISKELEKKGQLLAQEALRLGLQGMGEHLKDGFVHKRKMGTLFNKIKSRFDSLYDLRYQLERIIAMDRLCQKMIEIGGLPNLHPGVLAFLHEAP